MQTLNFTFGYLDLEKDFCNLRNKFCNRIGEAFFCKPFALLMYKHHLNLPNPYLGHFELLCCFPSVMKDVAQVGGQFISIIHYRSDVIINNHLTSAFHPPRSV